LCKHSKRTHILVYAWGHFIDAKLNHPLNVDDVYLIDINQSAQTIDNILDKVQKILESGPNFNEPRAKVFDNFL